MSRSQIITFYIDASTEPQFELLMAVLRKSHASFVRDARIHVFSDSGDGRDYVSKPCSEEDAFDTVAKLFAIGAIAAVDAEVTCGGRRMILNFDPSYDGQIVITILGNYVALHDGMIDFNWYYSYWKENLKDLVTITGIEFGVHV